MTCTPLAVKFPRGVTVNSRLHSFIINRARGLVSRSPKLEALIIQSVAIGAPAALKRVNPNNVFVSRKVTDVFAPEHWRERGVPTFLLSDLEFPNSILRRFDRTINSLVGMQRSIRSSSRPQKDSLSFRQSCGAEFLEKDMEISRKGFSS